MGQVSSQFSPGEISSIIIAWLVLSVAITYGNFTRLFTGTGNLEVVIAGFVATATGFIIHEMGHKFVAIRRGYVAHFRLWMWGLLLTLFIVVFSGGGIVFGAPGAVYIAPAAMAAYGYDATYGPRDPEQENMVISAAGPGINLASAIAFSSYWPLQAGPMMLARVSLHSCLLQAPTVPDCVVELYFGEESSAV